MEQGKFARQLRRSMTECEHQLWRHLRAHRLNGEKFRRQQPIGPYIVDFVHFGSRLIIEADGGQHNGSLDDERRDAWLRAQGFTVVRFWNNEIMSNLEGVLERIMALVVEAFPAPSPPTPLPQGERGDDVHPAQERRNEGPPPPSRGRGRGRGGQAS